MTRVRPLLPLATVLLPGVLLLVSIAAGGAFVASWLLGAEAAEDSVREQLSVRAADWSRFQQQRFRQLELSARLLAADDILLGYLEEPRAVVDTLEQYQNRLVFDFALIVDVEGRTVARSGVAPEGTDLVELAEREISTGVRREGDRIFHAVSTPLVIDYEPRGRLLVGLAVDGASLRRIRSPGVEALLVDAEAGSILEATVADPRIDRAVRTVLGNPVSREESTQNPVVVDGTVRVFTVPLRGADSSEVVRLALAADLERELAPFRAVSGIAAGSALVALLLGSLGAWAISLRVERPLRRLRQALESGDETPGPSGETGEIAAILAASNRRASEGRSRRELGGRVATALARRPPVASGTPLPPRSEKVAVVGFDLPPLVRPRWSDDAEANRADVARALAIVADEVEPLGGSWHGPAGARVLAVFRGEEPEIALGAAAAIASGLGGGEDGSDDAPAVALAFGTADRASLRTSRGELPILIGALPRRIDSLLREGSPGEILFSALEKRSLEDRLAEAEIEPRERRGFLSPRPFLALSAREAARVAGRDDEGRTEGLVQRYVPGAWLDLRWEVLGEASRGPWGARLKAVDRESGRLVRLDVLDEERENDPELRDRLAGVVRRLRDLRHPHVATLLHFGRLEGRFALVADWVEGESLADWLSGEGRDVPGARAALRIARDLAAGLVALHERGQAHGGIDPSRAMIDLAGTTRWIDPGLVPAFGDDGGGASADVAADLFALGELLEGLHGRVPEPRLLRAARRATAPEPGARWSSAVELRDALEVGPQDLA